MAFITLADDSGDTMTIRDLDGFYLPALKVPEEEWRSMPTWSARDDDVMLISYPKAGSHWFWEIIYMIISGSAEYKTEKAFYMIENITQATYDGLRSPRVMNSHLCPEHLPIDMFKRKNKIVLIMRNPKDVAVSFYNHAFNLEKVYNYHGEWKNYLQRFIQGKVDCGNVFVYMNIWQKFMEENPDYPICVIYYEDMIANGKRELKKLANFLGCKTDDAFLQSVDERCNFDTMKRAKEATAKAEILKNAWRDGKPMVYRKGKVGDWKNWFTVAQDEMFSAIIQRESANSVFSFKYDVQ